jgi:N utilization substance protein B
MVSRRESREFAMQILYQLEFDKNLYNFSNIQKKKKTKNHIDEFFQNFKNMNFVNSYTLNLIYGIHENEKIINNTLIKNSKRWKIHRISIVDKSIIKISIYELLYINDLNKKIIINEAVEIAKNFGSKKSYIFINGILNNIATIKEIP